MKKPSFETFYQTNIDRIFRYVFFRVGQNRDVAEDLVSEVFMKALKNFHKYDPKISQSAWIYRITQNHLANYFRDKKPAADIEDVKFFLVGDRGEEEMIKHEESRIVEQGLDQLTQEERVVVTMKYLEGYSYKEMAEILDRTADALKVASHRAVKKLRTLILPKHAYVPNQTKIEETSESSNTD